MDFGTTIQVFFNNKPLHSESSSLKEKYGLTVSETDDLFTGHPSFTYFRTSCSSLSVSYTHLDVYKRQVRILASGVAPTKSSICFDMSGQNNVFLANILHFSLPK